MSIQRKKSDGTWKLIIYAFLICFALSLIWQTFVSMTDGTIEGRMLSEYPD